MSLQSTLMRTCCCCYVLGAPAACLPRPGAVGILGCLIRAADMPEALVLAAPCCCFPVQSSSDREGVINIRPDVDESPEQVNIVRRNATAPQFHAAAAAEPAHRHAEHCVCPSTALAACTAVKHSHEHLSHAPRVPSGDGITPVAMDSKSNIHAPVLAACDPHPGAVQLL